MPRWRTLLLGSLLALLARVSCAAPAAETLLAQLAARDFAALEALLSAERAGYRPEPDAELALWNLYRVFGIPAARTEDLQAWVEASPGSYDAQLATAMHYRVHGWNARGLGFASKTTPMQFSEAHGLFSTAMAHARRALDLEPGAALSHAMILDLVRHTAGPVEAGAAYTAALEAAPRSYLVRSQQLGMLRPRWGGSLQAMEALVGEARADGLPEQSVSRLEALRLAYLAVIDEDAEALKPALELARRSIALHETPYAQELHGRLLRKLGDLPAAQAAFARTAELDPLDADVLSKLGAVLWRRGQRPAALEQYRRAAQLGHGWAAGQAGLILLHGAGVPRNPREAFDWFTLGARLGSPDAMGSLGACYQAGNCGVPVDYARALHWLQRAEAYGDDHGTAGLAAMLWNGEGTPRREGEAVRLWMRTLHSKNADIRWATRLNLAHLIDLRRGVPALVQASGHPALAGAVFAAMAGLPLLALLLAVRDGAIALTRRRPDPAAPRVIGARRLLWALAWMLPPAAGVAAWVAYLAGYVPEFIVAAVLFALLCVPSLLVLYLIGSGEWRVDVDGRALRYDGPEGPQEVLWKDIERASREAGGVQIVTRAQHKHRIETWPFGAALWREIETRRKA